MQHNMATNNNDLTCCLCRKIYTNPIILSPCGHSFDHKCILEYTECPIGMCNAPVLEKSLLPNYALKNLINNYNQSAKCTYEIFLLDTSTSMWYSDFFIGLFGTSRFEMAIQFLKEIFEKKWNSDTNQVSLVTFDTNPLQQFPFDTIRQNHLDILQNLRPNGSRTALFDSIKFCLEKFEKLNQITPHCAAQSLYILTDGADNFSSSGNQKQYIDYIKKRSKKLNSIIHVIQVGDKNLSSTKDLCDQLDCHFHHFNNGNASQFVNSFLSSSNQYVQNLNQVINALPDACTTPVQPILNKKSCGYGIKY